MGPHLEGDQKRRLWGSSQETGGKPGDSGYRSQEGSSKEGAAIGPFAGTWVQMRTDGGMEIICWPRQEQTWLDFRLERLKPTVKPPKRLSELLSGSVTEFIGTGYCLKWVGFRYLFICVLAAKELIFKESVLLNILVLPLEADKPKPSESFDHPQVLTHSTRSLRAGSKKTKLGPQKKPQKPRAFLVFKQIPVEATDGWQ